MFRLQNNVPEVYPDKSRDFQMFCRLFDVAFGSVKQSIDTMEHVTSTKSCDSALLPLLKDKLGFFSSLELTDYELRYILQAFPTIIRYKGSKQAIDYILNLYSRLVSSIASAEPVNLVVDNSNYVIELSSKKAVFRSQLLFELLRYVLPTGYTIEYFVTEYQNSRSTFYAENTLVYGAGLSLQLFDADSSNCWFLTKNGADDFLSCCINGYTEYPVPNEFNGSIELENVGSSKELEEDLPYKLKFVSKTQQAEQLNSGAVSKELLTSGNLVFYNADSGIPEYYIVPEFLDNEWQLRVKSVDTQLDAMTEEYFQMVNIIYAGSVVVSKNLKPRDDVYLFKIADSLKIRESGLFPDQYLTPKDNKFLAFGARVSKSKIVIKKDVSTRSSELLNIVNVASITKNKGDVFDDQYVQRNSNDDNRE